MALQKKYSQNIYGQTLEFETAYHKISYVAGNKDSIVIKIYIYNNNKCEFLMDTKEYTFSPSVDDTSSNFIKQGYEYLKTLDEYKDAIDLLDEGQEVNS